MTTTAAILVAGMVGITFLLFFAMAAFGCAARADALTEQQQRDAQRAAERLGVGGGADFHTFRNLTNRSTDHA